jgi:hypothetical protein
MNAAEQKAIFREFANPGKDHSQVAKDVNLRIQLRRERAEWEKGYASFIAVPFPGSDRRYPVGRLGASHETPLGCPRR